MYLNIIRSTYLEYNCDYVVTNVSFSWKLLPEIRNEIKNLIIVILCVTCFRILRQPSVSSIAVATNCQHPNTLQNSKQPMRGEYSELTENMKWKSQNIAGPQAARAGTPEWETFLCRLWHNKVSPCQGECEGGRNSSYFGTLIKLTTLHLNSQVRVLILFSYTTYLLLN